MDWVLLIIVVTLTFLTPRLSTYRSINLVLVGEFCVFFGIVELANLYLEEGSTVYAIKLAHDLVFAFIFWRIGGKMLSKVQCWIAVFHASLIATLLAGVSILDNNYTTIMAGFCTLQILCCLRGALHGIVCSHHVFVAGNSVGRRRTP